MAYHKKTKGLSLAYRISGLNRNQARGLEEIGMLVCHTLKNGSKGINNRIHGIAAKNPKYGLYISAAEDYIKNRMEEDILNLGSFFF